MSKSLLNAIPGLSKHSAPRSEKRFDRKAAARDIDPVMTWLADAPAELLAWLKEEQPELHDQVMAAWQQIDVAERNRDNAGFSRECTRMFNAMRHGLQKYLSRERPVEEQHGLFAS